MPHIPGHKKKKFELPPQIPEGLPIPTKETIQETIPPVKLEPIKLPQQVPPSIPLNLREREKRTFALMQTGLSEKAARQQAKREIRESGEVAIAGEQLAQQVGQVGEVGRITPDDIAKMTPEQLKQFQAGIPENPTDILSYEQAWKSALAGAGIGATGGVAVGLFTGGTASIPLGVLGAIGGFATGFFSNLAAQRADMLKGESANVRKQEQNMLKLVMDVNRGGDPTRNLEMFNSQMNLIGENYARLHMKSNDELSLWLGDDGHIQLERYEVFYSAGGMRDILEAQMRDALANPNLMNNLQLESWLTEGEEEE